jgi:triacylglycerol lipase
MSGDLPEPAPDSSDATQGPDASDARAAAVQDIRSRLDGPIANLSFLARSLLFAELAMTSYLAEGLAREVAAVIGLPHSAYLDRQGPQAFVFANDHDVVVVVRGTEPHEWSDIRADANAIADLAETTGRVHRGFRQEADELWPQIRAELPAVNADDSRDLWFCGHSLGGAVAMICALRCAVDRDIRGPAELYTYGSPRIGNKDYVRHARLTHRRWVHNNDIVTRVPPRSLGFSHADPFQYIDGKGRWNPALTAAGIARDRRAAFWHGVRRRRLDSLGDHRISGYVYAIGGALDAHGDLDPDSRVERTLMPRLPALRSTADARRLLDRLLGR